MDGPGQAGELFAATDGEPRAWPSHQQQPAAPVGDLGEKLGLLSVEAARRRRVQRALRRRQAQAKKEEIEKIKPLL